MSTEKAACAKAHFTSPAKAGLAALSLIAFAAFIALMPWQVSAQETTSHAFSGSVLVGGQAPPDGSILTPWLGSRRLGQVAIRRGRFRVVIPQRRDVALAGREISFRLDGRKLHGTGIWRAGTTTDLKLTITRAEYLRGPVAQTPTSPSVSDRNSSPTTDLSFVGVEPEVCDTLGIDSGVLRGAIYSLREGDRARSIALEIGASLNQIGCRLVGEWNITAPSSKGSGPFHGTVDGNFVRFTVPGEPNDAVGNLNFSGIYKGNHILGQYFSSGTLETGEWVLSTRRHAAGALANWARSIEESSPGVLSELRHQWEVQAAAENQKEVRGARRADSARAPQVAQPTPADAEQQAPPSNTVSGPAKTAPTESGPAKTAPTEERKKRGFFFNSISVDSDSVNALDPTTLAVIGILITLVATGVQLFRGN